MAHMVTLSYGNHLWLAFGRPFAMLVGMNVSEKAEFKFLELQGKYVLASKAVQNLEIELEVKYGSGNIRYSPRKDQNILETLRRMRDRKSTRLNSSHVRI